MPDAPSPVTLATGYHPGAIGAIAALHGRHYAASHGFDEVFEAKVARELGDFCCRYDPRVDRLWLALRGEEVLGSVVIDGGEKPGVAHLRWFILAPGARGLGKRLMDEAMSFIRSGPFESAYLWTLADLDAAIHLYDLHGWKVAERVRGTQWGKAVDAECCSSAGFPGSPRYESADTNLPISGQYSRAP